MTPRTLRLIELICGLGATLLGLAIPTYTLIVGTYPFRPESGDPTAMIVQYGAVALVGISAVLDSVVHLGTGIGLALALLWVATGTVWCFVLTPSLTVNWAILPAATLGLVAAVCGSWSRLETSAVE